MLIDVKTNVNPQGDSVELILDLVGNDPFQHEFLKEVFAEDLQESADEKAGTPDALAHAKTLGAEDLRVRIVTKTTGAFARASRTIENRRRAEAGQPSVEQEEAATAEAAKTAAAAVEAAKVAAAQAAVQADLDKKAQAAGFPNAQAQRDHETMLATEEEKGAAFQRGVQKAQAAAAPAAPAAVAK